MNAESKQSVRAAAETRAFPAFAVFEWSSGCCYRDERRKRLTLQSGRPQTERAKLHSARKPFFHADSDGRPCIRDRTRIYISQASTSRLGKSSPSIGARGCTNLSSWPSSEERCSSCRRRLRTTCSCCWPPSRHRRRESRRDGRGGVAGPRRRNHLESKSN